MNSRYSSVNVSAFEKLRCVELSHANGVFVSTALAFAHMFFTGFQFGNFTQDGGFQIVLVPERPSRLLREVLDEPDGSGGIGAWPSLIN